MALRAGIGRQVNGVAPGHKSFQPIGLVAKSRVEVRPHAGAAELFAQQQQRRSADAAAHDGDALVLLRQRGGVKAVAARAGDGQHIAGAQRRQLVRAFAFELVQKGQRAGLAVKIMDADGAREHRRRFRRPGAQHIELPGVGFAAGVLPLHDEAADVGRGRVLRQHL